MQKWNRCWIRQKCTQRRRSTITSISAHFFRAKVWYDFSNVRVHTDLEAADTAKKIHAKAFTIGSDVVFGTGQYAPETIEGSRVLSHELTHVIQQDKSSIENLLCSRFLYKEMKKTKALQAAPEQPVLPGWPCTDTGVSGWARLLCWFGAEPCSRWIYSAIHGLEVLLQPHEIISAAESTLNRFFHPPEEDGVLSAGGIDRKLSNWLSHVWTGWHGRLRTHV